MLKYYNSISHYITETRRMAKNPDAEECEKQMYKTWEPIAYNLKVHAQMLTGVAIILLLILKILIVMPYLLGVSVFQTLQEKDTLALVGQGLMYSAGFELAYMLFTPGPDEALQPVILGMAATILIVLSNEKLDWYDAVIPPVLCISIGILFIISRFFIEKQRSEQ